MENGNSTPNTQPSAPNEGTPNQGQASPGRQTGAPQSQSQGSDVKNMTQAADGKASSQSQNSDIFEVKVNGKVVKMTRQELIDNASMVHAANARFEEAAKTKKEVERFR